MLILHPALQRANDTKGEILARIMALPDHHRGIIADRLENEFNHKTNRGDALGRVFVLIKPMPEVALKAVYALLDFEELLLGATLPVVTDADLRA